MHSPDKAKVVQSLGKFSNLPNIIVNKETQYAFDGGNLICKMGNWEKKLLSKKYSAVCCLCYTKVWRDCCNSISWTSSKPATKDHAHKSKAQSTLRWTRTSSDCNNQICN